MVSVYFWRGYAFQLQSDQEELKLGFEVLDAGVPVASIGPGGIEIGTLLLLLTVCSWLQSDQEELKCVKLWQSIFELPALQSDQEELKSIFSHNPRLPYLGFNRTRRN